MMVMIPRALRAFTSSDAGLMVPSTLLAWVKAAMRVRSLIWSRKCCWSRRYCASIRANGRGSVQEIPKMADQCPNFSDGLLLDTLPQNTPARPANAAAQDHNLHPHELVLRGSARGCTKAEGELIAARRIIALGVHGHLRQGRGPRRIAGVHHDHLLVQGVEVAFGALLSLSVHGQLTRRHRAPGNISVRFEGFPGVGPYPIRHCTHKRWREWWQLCRACA